MKKYKKTNSQKGFALVEVIAALGISALVITALISLAISTLRTSLDSKLLLEGTKVANREVELVRAYRDGMNGDEPRSWSDFITDIRGCYGPSACHMNLDGSLNTAGSNKNPPSGPEAVTRQFIVTKVDGSGAQVETTDNVVRISVSVTWTIGDQPKGSFIYTDLSNWRGR